MCVETRTQRTYWVHLGLWDLNEQESQTGCHFEPLIKKAYQRIEMELLKIGGVVKRGDCTLVFFAESVKDAEAVEETARGIIENLAELLHLGNGLSDCIGTTVQPQCSVCGEDQSFFFFFFYRCGGELL